MRAVCSGKIEKLLPLLQFRVQFYIDLVTQQPIELRLEPMTTIGSDLLDTKNSSQGGYRMSPNKMVARGRIEIPTRGFSVFSFVCLLSSRLI
jgi:hypothetical protein